MNTHGSYRGWPIEFDGVQYVWEMSSRPFDSLEAVTADIDKWELMVANNPQPQRVEVRHA